MISFMAGKSSGIKDPETRREDGGRLQRSGSPPVTPTSRPPSLDFSSKRSSVEVQPLSPTGYQQPPTPDHPPPSPMTAVLGIHEKINPKAKRRSRDMETITEAEFLSAAAEGGAVIEGTEHTIDGSTELPAGSHHSPGGASLRRKKNLASSDDLVIFANGNDPYLGLTKGAIPKGQRRVKSQIFDSLPHLPRSKRRISAPGICVNFDPLMEGEECPARERISSQGGVHLALRRSCMEGDGEDGSLDENEEWAKIAAILSSCGGRMSAAEYCDNEDFERRLEKIFSEEKRGRPIQSVGEWLEALGLPQYENTLVANGFDDTDFLGPNILEECDLIEINITNPDHRAIILEASSQIPPLQSIVEGSTPVSVAKWLESLRLCDYLETFLANNFTTMDRVRNIWELELNSVLDITTLGHRKRILASLRVPPEVDAVSQSDDFMDFTKEWREMSRDQTEELANLNLFKDYTNVRPLTRQRADYQQADDSELCELCQLEVNGIQLDENTQVQIRPPSTSSAESIGVKQWRHQPEVLIKGCCNYTVQYLGSTLVKSLQGTESTRESIHKMKKSSDGLAKVPSVVLSISYRGVKFIDARSKHVICEHDISNIFCACQDGENLNYFAYITRDHVTECHYCHVFCVRSTELATEIILTLGEAFEVAYQVAIRERVIDELKEDPETDSTLDTRQVAAPAVGGDEGDAERARAASAAEVDS